MSNNKHYFSSELVRWYEKERRDLPWRRTRDPYHIWVSEIMLQQTRVDTVIPYFNRFVDRFPSVRQLAEAPEEEVLKHWEGLGYYSRARNLQSAVREVVDRYGGEVPRLKEEVSGLKGVGPYTAGAILSIAFDQPEPAVDGNVMRVLSRFFGLEDDIARPATRVRIEGVAKELIPHGKAADFNQALMELGAMICTPKSPACPTCPVREMCSARLQGRQSELPVKTKAKPPKFVLRLAALVEGTGIRSGKVLVRQRPKTGLLARMWELPHLEAPGQSVWDSVESGCSWLEQEFAQEGLMIKAVDHIGDAQHTFTHLHWNIRVMSAVLQAEESAILPPHYQWVGPDDFENYVWPNVFRKVLTQYFIGMYKPSKP
ncbi:adenine glycosylase [Cohnella kolymensis]|uniref:Adenine DNA glycosylase n=1 Tax=Cohnella kolymensis TaxID=1590652 RepID=A0ABR5A6W7_9BACL|nr:A/G-specific adenine glycosylase [Cohnella kolymensis]KIL36789.1 adenine glycosylase [Cohnella kolymensis]KIL37428.1 adenine glycosylase [Cohnella kolymensis]